MDSENTQWHKKSTPAYPPPERKSERRLSLKAAMALATGAPGHETLMPLVRRNDKALVNDEDSRKKTETYLLDLQADVINREELLEQKEKRFAAREKDLNRRANVLKKKVKEIESRIKEIESATLTEKKKPVEPPEEESEIKSLGDESEGDLFEETRQMLREREAYIEECENALVEKLTEITKREAEIEQREEQLAYKIKQSQ